MVPNLTAFVLLACACVTINALSVPFQEACMKIRKGSTLGMKQFVRPKILPPGETWKMPLPRCLYETVGVDVLVCDDDKIPAVKFIDSSTLEVHRTGSLDSFIVVRFTLYCFSEEPQVVPQD